LAGEGGLEGGKRTGIPAPKRPQRKEGRETRGGQTKGAGDVMGGS